MNWALPTGVLMGEIELIEGKGSNVAMFRSHTLRPWVDARRVREVLWSAKPVTTTLGSPVPSADQLAPLLEV